MDSTNAAATNGEAKEMSEIGRLVGVFWEPRPVFEELARRPRWVVPLVLGIVLGVVFILAFSQYVGWEAFLRQELANNPRTQDLSPAQMEQVIQTQAGITGMVSYAAVVVWGVLALVLVAAVLLFVMKTAGGGDLNFKQAFAITCYGWLPFSLYTILSIVAVALTNPADFNLKNPLPFNAGWFLDPSSSPAWLVSFLTSMDLFSIWVMALLGLGFSVAAKKVKFGKAFGLVIAMWLVYVLGKTGLAALF